MSDERQFSTMFLNAPVCCQNHLGRGDTQLKATSQVESCQQSYPMSNDTSGQQRSSTTAKVIAAISRSTLKEEISVESTERIYLSSCSSSSETEDLVLLDEIERIKTRLMARVNTKRQRKTTVDSTDAQNSNSSTSALDDTYSAQSQESIKYQECIVTTPTPFPQSPDLADETVTPPVAPNPLVSPGLQTPSPPSRTRYLRSPPSGSISRKRQHSPSPMSRQLPPGSAGRSRRLTSPIRSFEGRLLSAKPSPNPTPRKEIEAISIGNEAPDQLDDFWDDDKDLEQMIDEGIFDDEPSSQSSTTAAESAVMPEPREGTQTDTLVRERTAPAWTSPPPEDIDRGNSVGPRKKPRIAVTQGKSVWAPTANTTDNKSTFSVADATPLSLQDAAQLNHTPEYDPLSGLRIRDRTVPCEVVAGLTKDTTTIPLMDEAHIREHCQHASRSGLLPSNTRPMVSLGKLPSESKGTEGDTDEKQSSTPWLIAGVVGAKSPKRMTARKSPYCHFQLSDLRRGIVNVFMFRSVMEKHYDQIQPGDIVVILEPKVLDLAERSGVLGTEVDHPNRLLVLGVSMDFGQCEAVKMNGQNCGKVLDKRGSIYCMQHIMMAANKQRNQRGSLIVGTSSIYDLNTNPGPGSRDSSHGPRSQHAFVGQKKKIERDSSGATYLLGDGEVATSSQTSLAAGGSKRLQQTDDTLSTYLMSQNNLGGQYLKQAMSSKDVAWAKDITSPKKAPAENSELFPAEMVRRMGYDPVTGKFVPGSPKRSDDDPEARERSIRLLAERIKSPPRAISPLAALFHAQGKGASRGRTEGGRSNPANSLLMGRRRAGSPTPSPAVTRTATSSQPQQNTGSKQWVDLTDDSGDDSDDGPRLPSLAQQRAKNLRDAAKRKGTSQKR